MWQRQPSREDACSLNLHGLQYLCKSGLDPVLQLIQLSCLFPNGVTSGGCHWSLGLSFILKEVAGGSGRLRPLLAPRSELGEHLPWVPLFLMSKSCTHPVVWNQSTFKRRLHVHPPGPMKPHSKGLFTWRQRQSPAASPRLGPSLPSHPVCSLVVGGGQVAFPQAGGGSKAVDLRSTKGAARVSLPVPQLTTNHPPAFQLR